MRQRIAITVVSHGGLDTPMDPRFGRAPAFVLTDPEGRQVEVVGNTAAGGGHGAGTGAAALMADRGVTAVVAGRFGPKAATALGALGVAMWLAPEGLTARQALELYGSGRLSLHLAGDGA